MDVLSLLKNLSSDHKDRIIVTLLEQLQQLEAQNLNKVETIKGLDHKIDTMILKYKALSERLAELYEIQEITYHKDSGYDFDYRTELHIYPVTSPVKRDIYSFIKAGD
jgi:hypothetical protein